MDADLMNILAAHSTDGAFVFKFSTFQQIFYASHGYGEHSDIPKFQVEQSARTLPICSRSSRYANAPGACYPTIAHS